MQNTSQLVRVTLQCEQPRAHPHSLHCVPEGAVLDMHGVNPLLL
jgi:hypothetical protein